VPFAVKKELNCDNLFENYGSETGFGLEITRDRQKILALFIYPC
jgi:hypothetical protein